MQLSELTAMISPADERAKLTAKMRWDSIAKPLGGLGLLEEAVIRIAGMTGSADVDLGRRAVIAMCADNGVVAQGVTQTGQEVTAIVTENMSSGCTSVCRMANVAGCEVIPVDIGVAVEVHGERIRQSCIRRGTADFTKGPAMTREEAERAIMTGAELVRELHGKGYGLIGTGEMGIGNTTTSSAVVSVLLGKEPELVTGRGAGLSSEGLRRKIEAIATGIAGQKRPGRRPRQGRRARPRGALRSVPRRSGLQSAGRHRRVHLLGGRAVRRVHLSRRRGLHDRQPRLQ